MKLSKTQEATLNKMEPGKWYCASALGVRLSTLEGLRDKGLVKRRDGPLVGIEYKKKLSQGGQPGNTNAATKDGPVTRRCTFRLFPQDEYNVAFAAKALDVSKNEAVRRAIRELAERLKAV